MSTLFYLLIIYFIFYAIDRHINFMNTKTPTLTRVSITQVAERLGVHRRTINLWLNQKKEIPFILSYEKMNPDNITSPFIITPSPDFFDRRKKYVAPKKGRQPGAKEGIDFNIISRPIKKK